MQNQSRWIMYSFHIERKREGVWRFEREGVNMIIEDYTLKNDKHQIINPLKTIAYFYVDGNIFSFRNRAFCHTAEDFFDLIKKQLALLKRKTA